jgi:hypothetical protein
MARVYELRQLAERGVVPNDDVFRERWPALFSILVNNRLGEDQWTEPARLSISNSSGDWCASLSAPGLAGYTETLGATFDQALTALDVGIASASLKWRFNLKKRGRPRKDASEKK